MAEKTLISHYDIYKKGTLKKVITCHISKKYESFSGVCLLCIFQVFMY